MTIDFIHDDMGCPPISRQNQPTASLLRTGQGRSLREDGHEEFKLVHALGGKKKVAHTVVRSPINPGRVSIFVFWLLLS